MFKRSLELLLFACLFVAASWAVDNPFVGDWKLNPSRSKLTDQMKVESIGGNKYMVDVGAGPEPVVVDGPDQPRPDGSTVSVTSEGPNACPSPYLPPPCSRKKSVRT